MQHNQILGQVLEYMKGLRTPKQAADMKGMSLSLFDYYINKDKDGAPKPVPIGIGGRIKLYHVNDLAAWNPRDTQ